MHDACGCLVVHGWLKQDRMMCSWPCSWLPGALPPWHQRLAERSARGRCTSRRGT